MYFRPNDLRDRVIDFQNFTDGNISVSILLHDVDHALQYSKVVTESVSHETPLIINQLGDSVPEYSIIKLDAEERNYSFRRSITGPGNYSDKIGYFERAVTFGADDPRSAQAKPFATQVSTYNYMVFQKAVPVVKVGDLAEGEESLTTIKQNQLVTMEIDVTLVVDCSASRGVDKGSSFAIYKRNNDGDWETAVYGSDYSLDLEAENSLYHVITFLTSAEYKFVFTAIGYDSNENPYGYYSETRELINNNRDSVTFYVNVDAAVTEENITLPQIEALVQPMNDQPEDFDGILAYTNTNIIVSPNILYETGIWIVGENEKIPTEDEWLNELNISSTVKLHVYDSEGADVIAPLNGLGPHIIKLNVTGSMDFKYVVTLK